MLFESNVFNMIDWFIDDVEPRTGMYIRTIPIIRLPSCNMQGPVLDLKLFFNQFNKNDYGFGSGWEINLSRIDTNSDGTRWLVLADGARYKIMNDANTGPVQLQYQRTRTFRLEKDSTGNYRIINKNGTIETISNNRTTRITAPNGQFIAISWSPGDKFTITDSQSQLLISCGSDKDSRTTITTPKNTLIFSQTRSALENRTEIINQDSSGTAEKIYYIEYKIHNEDYMAISVFCCWVNFFQQEWISYKSLDTPSEFPGIACAVSEKKTLVSTINFTRNTVTTGYDFGNRNYLGHPDIPAWKTGVDNLEMHPGFTFITKETTGTSRLQWRQYNHFYLQEADIPLIPGETPETVRNGKSVQYTYRLEPDQGIDAQSPTFSLPESIRSIRYGIDKDNKLVSEIDIDSYTYDSDGNVTSTTRHDGSSTKYDYYPAGGESSTDTQGNPILFCPPDPNGFINYLKREAIMPSPPSTLPPRIRLYSYKTHANLGIVIPVQKKFTDSGGTTPDPASFFWKESYTHDENTPNPTGKLLSTVFSKNSLEQNPDGQFSIKTWNTSTSHTYQFNKNEDGTLSKLTINTVITGFDSTTRMNSETYNIRTGAIVSMTDENQQTSIYEHDSLGRVTKKQYSWPSSPTLFATDTFTYDSQHGTVTEASTTTDFQIQKKSGAQGQLLSISYSIKKQGEDGIPETISYLMEENSYNELGQLKQHIEYDCDKENNNRTEEVTEYNWNIYDEPVSQKNADNSSQTWIYDYLNNTHSTSTYPAYCELKTVYDNTGKPVKTERYNLLSPLPLPPSTRIPDQTDIFTYDGFGRLIRHESDISETFSYIYDAFDREIEKTGSISGNKKMEYAPHTTAGLVTKITSPADQPCTADLVIGSRLYDGIDRLVSSTINQSITSYQYSGSGIMDKPAKIIHAGGRIFNFKYNPALGQPTIREVMKNEKSTTPAGTRTYSFHEKTGHLKEAIGGSDRCTQKFSYDEFGNWIEEFIEILAPAVNRSVHCIHTRKCTLRGKPIVITSRINFPDSYRPGKYLLIKKQYFYEKNGGVQSIDISIDNVLVSASLFSRTPQGQIERIESYSRISGNIYWRLDKTLIYGAYENIESVKYNYKDMNFNNAIFHQKIDYDKNNKPIESTTSMGTASWTENYKNDASGFMTEWRNRGSLVFENEYGKQVTSQNFTQNNRGALADVSTMTQQGPNHSTYIYSHGSLTRTTNNSPGYPASIDIFQDAEGHVIKKKEDYGNQNIKEKTFIYAGEDNHSTFLASGTSEKTTQYSYVYDAQGRIAKVCYFFTTGETQSGYVENIRLYSENTLFCEIDFFKRQLDMIPCKIYHRINEETMFVTSIFNNTGDENFSDSTCSLCLNQFNGSQIAKGTYQCDRRILSIEPRIDMKLFKKYRHETYYRFQTNGQNPYGFTLNIADQKAFVKGNLYSYDSKTNEMRHYTGSPPILGEPQPSALGAMSVHPAAFPLLGMHGERIDWLSTREQLYLLGHGARSYDPALQCFLSQDPYSPFSAGGINPYAFCGGDPVNQNDQSGHVSNQAICSFALAILGLLLGAVTFGLGLITTVSLGAMLAYTSGLLGIASGVIGGVSAALEETDPELSRTLGWTALGLGIASTAVGLIGPSLATYAIRTGRLLLSRTPKVALAHRQTRPITYTWQQGRKTMSLTRRSETIGFYYAPRYKGGAMVETHGDIGEIQRYWGSYTSRPSSWARELMRRPEYVHSQEPLYLFACESASPVPGGLSNAAIIAKTLGRPVYAFDSPSTAVSWTWAQPMIYVARGSNWGKLVLFKP